jgi:DNA-binding CsgD family transcriptional regulator
VTQGPGAPSALDEVSGEIVGALEDVSIPSYLLDAAGVVRWINAAAEEIVGDVRGRQFTSLVSDADNRRSREAVARLMLQTANVVDESITVIDREGRDVRAEFSSVALVQGHRVVGVFGQVPRYEIAPTPAEHAALTPRQQEVLHLLEQGYSTPQIAKHLYLSEETVRNHIRHLFRSLGVHSRLEAVAVARRARAAVDGARPVTA